MPGDIVNLRQHRRRRDRTDRERRAAANRAKYGRTRTERQRDAHGKELGDAALAGKELDADNDGPAAPANPDPAEY